MTGCFSTTCRIGSATIAAEIASEVTMIVK